MDLFFKVMTLCLVVSAFAQPTPPSISETFTTEFEVERHDKQGLEFGRGYMGRDPPNARAIFNTTYDKGHDIDYQLMDYSKHYIYTIKGPKDEAHCNMASPDATILPAYWYWLKDAHYAGKREIRHLMYDFWISEDGDTHRELGVEANSTKTPAFYIRRVPELEVTMRFMKFEMTAPPSADFIIPKECQQPPQ